MGAKKLLYITALLLFSGVALAHPGHFGHESFGFVSGLLHPLTGFDHLIAMFAVGLWAAQQQGAARLIVPATFVIAMLMGGLLSAYLNIPLLFIENGIAVSVLALGLLVALAVHLPLRISVLMIALFAINHGYAHGIEIPDLANPAGFIVGFVLSTIGLHGTGFGLANILPDRFFSLIRALGVFFAGAGLWMLTA
ncbi:HupE/UreJ protein [Candidatus Nitrosoglobus terrae]|uniref:HupE/UreJ protein n=2 Tax=Candidatus Nitrosoglobus terrae TaxID=1630141 RepID=A0A1Q2SM25_9GAMM|nr:HupE/UreJ protein [Candidatus Nitrosoglobus terrae]